MFVDGKPESDGCEARSVGITKFKQTVTVMANPIRILLAEDNKINQRVIVAFLLDVDCQMDIVENGVEAVAAVGAGRYDLVLMDVHMPEMNGVTAAQMIRALPEPNASIPIVAVTADGSDENKMNCMLAGMNDIVTKPIDKIKLIGSVCRYTGAPTPDVESISDTEI